jgi:hypothetical protein
MRHKLARAGRAGWQVLSSLSSPAPARRRPAASKLALELLEPRDLPSGFAQPDYRLVRQGGGIHPFGSPGPTGISPARIRHAYGFDAITFSGGTVTGDGTGTTIAIVDAFDDPTIASDLTKFDATFGLPDPVFTKVNQTGGSTPPIADSGWAVEIALDVEWAHAIAPKANILLVEANTSNDFDLYTAVRFAARQPGVVAVSMSWGGNEDPTELGNDGNFTTPAGHAGVTFLVSSGDSGAPPSYPAASPNVVSVGGTTLSIDSAGNYRGESAWGGSGGGISPYESQPAYQSGVVTQSSTQRTNPDVAYDSDPSTGFPVLATYSEGASAPWVQVGGTSDAAPQWAGLIAIADQGRLLAGEGTLDGPSQTLPMLYKLPAADFHDITSGFSTGTPEYSAGPGYDLVTGIGTPIANLVVRDLVGAPATPAAPTGLTATGVAPDQIQLTWTASTGAPDGYLIERSPDGSTGWTQVSSTVGSNVLLTDGGLTPSTTYYYRVRAYNAAGDSPYSTVASNATLAGTVSNLFADNFDGPTLGPAWATVGGTWVQSGGVLSQTSTANGDPRKAMITGLSPIPDTEITARVRVDTWINGDYSRAGVGLYTNAAGEGYNLIFHNDTHTVAFLDDHVRYGNTYTFSWTVGTWYWFQLEDVGGVLRGKIWADGTAAPTSWMFTQAGWTDRSPGGAPALNGGDTGIGGSTASFDVVSVTSPDLTPPGTPTSLTATGVSATQINLSWPDVSGEAGFKVERSPDGSTGWTQIGTTAGGVLTYSDTGLTPNTTYFYRVRGTNLAGDGGYSPVASGTTLAHLFSDNFSGSTLGPAWTTVGGSWSQSPGVLSQTSTANGDPRKAMVTGVSFPADVSITAKVRVDTWTNGDYARAGVGLYTNAAGEGYNLVFHNDTNTVAFLDDHVTYGNTYSFSWTVGTWYWFKLEDKGGVLYGKIWADGTTEPSAWMFTQGGWTDRSPGGAPALNGGDTGIGGSTASFASVTVDNAT